MKYLEESLKFFGKFFIAAIPLIVMNAIISLINGVSGQMTSFTSILDFSKKMSSLDLESNPQIVQDPMFWTDLFSNMDLNRNIGTSVLVGLLTIVFTLIVYPATYGMIISAMETKRLDLSYFPTALKDNFLKYLLYLIGTIVFGIIVFIASIIYILLIVLIASLIGAVGSISQALTIIAVIIDVLLVIAAIVAYIAGIAFVSTKLSLWFPAMATDGLSLFDAFKRSFSATKGYFWKLLGVSLLLMIASSVLSGMLFFLWLIPVVGPVILSLIPTTSGFILIVFYITIYRASTGRTLENESQELLQNN